MKNTSHSENPHFRVLATGMFILGTTTWTNSNGRAIYENWGQKCQFLFWKNISNSRAVIVKNIGVKQELFPSLRFFVYFINFNSQLDEIIKVT